MHKSAIELLEPHVNDHPQDTKALRALSKIYFQDRQFLKAATCLRRSVLPTQKQRPSNNESSFKQDTFSEEDIRYTEDLASKYDESEYDFETDRKPPEPVASIERCQDISAPPNKNDSTAKTDEHIHKTPEPSKNTKSSYEHSTDIRLCTTDLTDTTSPTLPTPSKQNDPIPLSLGECSNKVTDTKNSPLISALLAQDSNSSRNPDYFLDIEDYADLPIDSAISELESNYDDLDEYEELEDFNPDFCLLYTSPSPRD